MTKKIVLITGATSGIGKQTAISLAKLGYCVVITGRNREIGQNAIEEIKKLSGNFNVDLILSDISTQEGIYSLANQFKLKYNYLDILINNAGVASSSKSLTIDGIELNFATNVIAPFLLTSLLMQHLEKSILPRVITLTGGDLPSKIDLNNIQSEKSFNGLSSYSQSKIAMMCLMYELSIRNSKNNITINICYPGQASTNMTQSVTPEMLPFLLRPFYPIFKFLTKADNGISAKKASQSSVYLAISLDVDGKSGIYVDKYSKIRKMPEVVLNENNRSFIWDFVNNLLNINNFN